VITDSHAGVRNDNKVFLDNAKLFYDNVVFPRLKADGITHVLHLGDILDRRKYINFVTANRLRTDFIEPLEAMGCTIDHVLGNHDVYYKNTNAISGVIELYGNSRYPINIIKEAQEIRYGDLDIFLVPWISEDNREATLAAIKKTRASVCMGHLELSGFEMNKGSIMDHGMDANIFKKFDVVASGHYHHPSERGNVKYLGATGQFDWSDNDDPRGFHIFDTETLEFEHVPNPYEIFVKVYYNDSDSRPYSEILEDFSSTDFNNAFVKVVVMAKINPYFFDLFVDHIEKQGCADLQIIEEHLNMDTWSAAEIIDQADDTMTSIRKYVDSVGTTLDKTKLNNILETTYQEALTSI
jgi:predicted phosphodiesterase